MCNRTVSCITCEIKAYKSDSTYAKDDQAINLNTSSTPNQNKVRNTVKVTPVEGQSEVEIVVSSSDSYITTKNPVIYNNHSPKNCNSTHVENFVLGITPDSSVVSAENLTNTATENIITVPEDAEDDPRIALKTLRSKSVEGLIFGH